MAHKNTGTLEKNTKNQKKQGRKKTIPALLTGIAALAVLTCFYFHFHSAKATGENLRRLSTENYNAFFVSMYPIEGYLPEDFITYRGLNTLILDSGLTQLKTLTDYFNAAFTSGNQIETIYLGLDPASLWDVCLHQEKQWNNQLNCLLTCMDAHTDVTFEIMLPYPSLSYWTDMSEDELNETLTLYQAMGHTVSGRSNGRVHFIGAEEWLIANPGNYLEGFSVANAPLTHKIMLLNFCDKVYLMNQDTLTEKLNSLRARIESEKTSPTVYEDLSDWYFVFLGDSVMAYDTGSSSIPGVVNGLSRADTANLSQGGSPATEDPAALISLERMIDALETLQPEDYKEASDFYTGLRKYKTDRDSGVMDKKKLCFVICLGLNDYFGAHPVDFPSDPYDTHSYGGALRSGIRRLKELAPDGRILVMSPSFCNAFSGGTEKAGSDGGVLTDYVDTALKVCREMQVDCVNVYADSGINSDTQSLYLADGVHPNEAGRFLLGRFLINEMGGKLHEK